MRWWCRANPNEIALILSQELKPDEFASRLSRFGITGFWFNAYQFGRPLWSIGWHKSIRTSDIGAYLDALRQRNITIIASLDCFHDSIRFEDDPSSHPVMLVKNAFQNGYHPICPTHPAHLAALAGMTEVISLSCKPDFIAFEHLNFPLNWERKGNSSVLPESCCCIRCIHTAKRGDVGLSVCEGLEDSQDLPKYQCPKLKKSAPIEKIEAAWLIWRSAHISQVARDLARNAGKSRKIVSVIPPHNPQRLLEESDIRSGQCLKKIVESKMTLSPTFSIGNSQQNTKWVLNCMDAYCVLTNQIIPNLCGPVHGDFHNWRKQWNAPMEKLGIETGLVSGIGAWIN